MGIKQGDRVYYTGGFRKDDTSIFTVSGMTGDRVTAVTVESSRLGHMKPGTLIRWAHWMSSDFVAVEPADFVAVEPAPAPLNVCEEANKVAGGDRQRDYGHPLDNHQRIAALWNAYLNNRPKPEADITATDAALLMILLKVAREINTPKRDNLVDICGYAKCLESMYAEIEKRKGGAA